MPKRARSGIPNLYKKHTSSCRNRAPLKCDCPWYGKYKCVNVNLARWSGQFVDPRRRQHAAVVMNRLRAAVDEHYFRPEGDYELLGGKQTLGSFIGEWKEHYAKVHDLDFASITPMLRAIDRAFGPYTLEYLQNASLQIERWLNDMQRQRGWADNTWNRYYQMFNSLFVRAIKWKHGTIARMTQNPMAAINRRVGCTRRFRMRIEESQRTNSSRPAIGWTTSSRRRGRPHGHLPKRSGRQGGRPTGGPALAARSVLDGRVSEGHAHQAEGRTSDRAACERRLSVGTETLSGYQTATGFGKVELSL